MKTYTLKDIFDLVWNRRMAIIKFCGIVFILAAVISLFIPNKYKATTVFYAASDDLSRPDVMFGITKERSYFFGGNNERDRIISVSQSGQLLDSLLVRFDLYTHYDIERSGEKANQKLAKKFKKNFEVIHNDLDALELSVEDEDPEMAANLANASRVILNKLVSDIIKSSQYNFVNTLKQKVEKTEQIINSVNDSISRIRSTFGMYDSDNQVQQLAELVTSSKNQLESEQARLEMYESLRGVRRDTINNIKARITGLQRQIKAIENPDSASTQGLNIVELNRIKPVIQMLEGQYYTLKGEWARDMVQLDILNLAVNAETPAIHLVETASVPAEKFKPKRSILVLGTVIAALIFYILGLLGMEAYRNSFE